MTYRALLLAGILAASPVQGGGRWIAVVAPGLEDAVEPLAAQRQTEGWHTTLIPVTADTDAIRRRIAALAAESQPCCVVLVGDFGESGVPAGVGTKLRMTGEPTDLPWSRCANGAQVETGRLPARQADEARIMVRKILDWPRLERTQLPFPSVQLLGGHHGAPDAFAPIADNLTNTLATRLLAALPPEWQLEAAVHVDGSPWQVSGGDVGAAALRMMRTRATLFAYMGHSEPAAAVSKSSRLLDAAEWRRLPADGARPGLFITCGCFCCQVDPGSESLGLAAMRSPGGPPAVIGSHGESAAALGYLAVAGLTAALEKHPVRVGEFWQAALGGIESAPISPAEFAMLDMADGSQGKAPLDQQRAEHMEMWMLLGDPAMPLAPLPSALAVDAVANETGVTVSGTLPGAAAAGASLRITLERHPSAMPADLPVVPHGGPDRQNAARERRRLAGEVVFASANATATGAAFSTTITLPDPAPARPWTVRVLGAGNSPCAGVTRIR